METKTEQITEEQAVQIAEWLGFKESRFNKTSKWFYKAGCGLLDYELLKWLISPEGDVAVMDKLGEEVYAVRIYYKNTDNKVEVEITLYKSSVSARASTRQQALLDAVWKMLKGGE